MRVFKIDLNQELQTREMFSKNYTSGKVLKVEFVETSRKGLTLTMEARGDVSRIIVFLMKSL